MTTELALRDISLSSAQARAHRRGLGNASAAPQEPWVVPIDLPCPRCGHEVGRIGPGKGPHAAALRCDACDRFLMWIARRVLEILRQQRTAGGEPAR